MTDLTDRLETLFREIVTEAKSNDDFARRVERALSGLAPRGRMKGEDGAPGSESRRPRRPHRRAPGVIDPFAVYGDGEDALRDRLRELDVERLKDIVAEHGMDSAKLAMKWKTPARLVDLIVDTVKVRSRKGDAFRILSDEGQVP